MHRVAATVVGLLLPLAACSSGSAGSASAPALTASPTTSGASPGGANPAAFPDWPTYHGTDDRAGRSDAAALRPPLRAAWRLTLDAASYAEPIVAAGAVITATENNTVYAVDPSRGTVRWRTHLVAPARRSVLPCGNIDPSGITGTPAYDAATGLVFVVSESAGVHHTLQAIDASTGRVRWHRDLDILPRRDRFAEQERGAVLVTGGRVYVAFGGRDGDCGNYVGYIAAVATTGNGPTIHYAVPTAREAGMWAAAGPVVAPGGDIVVADGNGAEVQGQYDDSDSVLRLSPTLQRKALFAPAQWRQDNAQDLDLGSMSPAPVGGKIVIAGKRGTVYLLAPTLGGVGGEIASIGGCAGYGGAAVSGSRVVMPCDAGIRALDVSSNRLTWAWSAAGGLGSPTLAAGTVYALDRDRGDLVELALSNGHVRGRLHVGAVTRFATPTPVGGLVLVATTTQLVSVTGRS